jgi:8-oxo-dGTP diphosphatase
MEFPGGRVHDGERRQAALARELHEELGADVTIQEWLGREESTVGSARIVLDVYAAHASTRVLHAKEHSEIRWVAESELTDLDWAEADVPIVPEVRARMRAGRRTSMRR